MRVTVCELRCEGPELEQDWARLIDHARAHSSDVVLLPEMAFSPWFAAKREFAAPLWDRAVEAHDRWLERLTELGSTIVLGSRPVNRDQRRFNEGFVWQRDTGYRAVHLKKYLPDEEEFWEASWYHPGDGPFEPVDVGTLRVGFLICTDLWSMNDARLYGKAGAHLVASPRATPRSSLDKWLAGGKTSAVVSGAFSISSNRAAPPGATPSMGGQGWVIGPDAQVLGLTSPAEPIVTVVVDLAEADRAKTTYPRYAILRG